ncbi:MAG: inorganic phosphate transporter [Ruminococcaceae bacterium]|nr:inorganic phosphate transporter [Oscillospiraceae bacterium]
MIDFFRMCIGNPALLITTVLVLGVILVNGWTDAPNAIATVVSTRSLKPKTAILMAAVFNFLGVLVMSIFSKKVADTIYKMVDFGGDNTKAQVALCAALFAIVLWAVGAWFFGIPTSESHALIAGITGAAIAMSGAGGINMNEWINVIYGLGLSAILGFAMGFAASKTITAICRGMNRRKADRFFKGAQITGGAAMAFMHGAQDGLKFIGVFLLGQTLAQGTYHPNEGFTSIPIWLMILVSAIMALGTSIGGYKIIKSVGMDMVKLERYQGFAADIAGAICLMIASISGLPVSTTHTKTTAIMGVGAAKRLSLVNWSIVKEMVAAWILTFPGCGLIGFAMAKVFVMIF